MSIEEYTARYCGRKAENVTNARMAPMMRQTPLASIDLSKSIEVNPIRDQGNCGSCWTFSITAGTESRYYRNSGKTKSIDLSEQQLVECVYGRDGCQGGYTPVGVNWIKANGQTRESNVPYTATYSGACTKPSKDFISKGYIQFTYDVNTIKNALNTYGVLPMDGMSFVSFIFSFFLHKNFIIFS